jgi:hypothetical protein
MFAPLSVAIDAKAGSAKPAPLEVAGNLNFEREPYGLRSITVTKGIVRESLPAIFSIPVTPLREFEYSLKGTYAITRGVPTNLALSVQRHRFVGSGAYDLKGSSIASTVTIGSQAVTLTEGSLTLISNDAQVAQSTFSGTIPFDIAAQQAKLKLQAPLVDFDQLELLLSSLSSGSPEQQTTEPPPSSPPPTANATQPTLPLIDASISVAKAVYKKLAISDIAAHVVVPNSQQLDKAELRASFDNGGSFSFSSSGRLDQSLEVKARADKVNILPFAALAQGEGELLEGNLDLLDLALSVSPRDPRKTITGTLRTSVSRMIVPSTLQSQVPFNILFLPFDALITVFGGTLNALLPASISSISDGIREVLDDAGRLGIEKGTINLDFDRGSIACQQVEIDTKNLPDFTIKGRVSADDRLDFTIFIGLLKLNLPLPVAGTLSTPLPDLVYLGPEIVRGLGLSVGNIVGGVGSLLGGSGKDGSTPPDSAGRAP